jgi:hypothetical protein
MIDSLLWGSNTPIAPHIPESQMPKFISKKYKNGDQEVSIRTKELPHDLVSNNLLTYLTKAQQWLATCIAKCGESPLSSFVTGKVKSCFLIDPSHEYFEAIRGNLEIISLGLALKQIYKVVEIINDNKQTYGSTPLVYGAERTRKYHHIMMDYEKEKMARYGAIKLKKALFTDGMRTYGPITLIHEASHKYAGTWDYHYFDSMNGNPPEGFDDPDNALFNADSYAWFAYFVGKNPG